MDSVLFLFFAAAHFGLLLWGIAITVRRGELIVSDLALLVVLGLVYDNAVLSIGALIGEGGVLQALNGARYWLHALLTPLLVMVAWHVMARSGIRWLANVWAMLAAAVVTLALMVYEIVVGAAPMRLVPEHEYGALSYANANAPEGPPLMVLVVAVALLVAGVCAWVRQRWAWLTLATLVLIVGNAVPVPVPSGAITNAFELVLLIGVFATIAFQDRREELPALV